MIKKTGIILLLLFASALYAESVFLKDGRILEGTILGEQADQVSFRLADKTTVTLKRNEILRVLFLTTYKDRVFIYFTDNTVLEGHIVDEDAENYSYRAVLDVNQERILPKSTIKLITAKKLTQLQLGLKIQAGSGSIASLGPALQLGNFEVSFSPGYINAEDDYGIPTKALPLRVQGSYYFYALDFFRPYLMASAVYAIGIDNYKSQLGTGGGLGLEFFRIFYLEGGYHITGNEGGFALGLGFFIPLKIF